MCALPLQELFVFRSSSRVPLSSARVSRQQSTDPPSSSFVTQFTRNRCSVSQEKAGRPTHFGASEFLEQSMVRSSSASAETMDELIMTRRVPVRGLLDIYVLSPHRHSSHRCAATRTIPIGFDCTAWQLPHINLSAYFPTLC